MAKQSRQSEPRSSPKAQRQLTKEEKQGFIRAAVADAVFQQLADCEEKITDEAAYDTERTLEHHGRGLNVNPRLKKAVAKEIATVFQRMYESIQR